MSIRAEPRRWPAALATALVTVVVLGPLYVERGIALRGDMVFVPDQPWKPAGLGLDGSVPRAVPMDALISVVDEVLPGSALQRILLTAAFLAGGLGIARLARPLRPLAQVAAVVVYLWNPWVHERIAIGQWATVLAYGVLPWAVVAAARARDGRAGGWSGTALCLLLGSVCAPSMGLLTALVALAVVVAGGVARRTAGAVVLAVVANLPWAVPALLGPGLSVPRSQFDAFAARGESSLGTLASLLSMGGVWKTSIVPPERTHAVVVGVAALLSVAFLVGFRYAAPALGRRTAAAVAAVGGIVLLLALVPSWGPGGRALGSLSTAWPAVGMVRDSHRYLAPFGLLLALGAAALVDRLLEGAPAERRRRDRGDDRVGRMALAGLVVVAPVMLLPSLVWGLAGTLRPVTYPEDWSRVAAVTGRDGATVVLPWTGSYRGYAWNGRRAVLDPAARYLPGDVLVDDRLFLHDTVVAGEDAFLARVPRALREPDPAAALRDLGVRWVLVEKGNGVEPSVVPPGVVTYDGPWLRLVDLGSPAGTVEDRREAPPAWAVLAVDIGAVLTGCVSFVHLARGSFATRR